MSDNFDPDGPIQCTLCGFWIASSDANITQRIILAHVEFYHPDAMTLVRMEEQFHEGGDHGQG